MPVAPKVLQLAFAELGSRFPQLSREHVTELTTLYQGPHRNRGHTRSRTFGRLILAAICKAHEQRATAIRDAFARALPFQGDSPLTTSELAAVFQASFEEQRSDVLEFSRQRLAAINSGQFIHEAIVDAQQRLVWLRGEAEHVLAELTRKDNNSASSAAVHHTINATNIGSLQTGGNATANVNMLLGQSDRDALLSAIEQLGRELEAMHELNAAQRQLSFDVIEQLKAASLERPPKPALVRTLFGTLSLLIRTAGSAAPAWELARAAARPLGIELPEFQRSFL